MNERTPSPPKQESRNEGLLLQAVFEQLLNEPKIDRQVQEQDPLGADSFLVGELPSLNEKGDVDGIVKGLNAILPNEATISEYSIVEGRAALRDVGHAAASLRRHSVDVNTLEDVKTALVALGIRIGEVPRDTVFSYGSRNPEGDRQRRFTNLEEERRFINSFKEGMQDLYSGISSLVSAYEAGPYDAQWGVGCANATDAFEKMVEAIRNVRKEIPPEVFTFSLRPYFDPIAIDGKTYFAPGGAQMPVLLFDQLIWGSDCEDTLYSTYKNDNFSYSPPSVRAAFSLTHAQPSMLTKLTHESTGSNGGVLLDNARALFTIMNSIMRFRAPHLKIAQENFALRSGAAVGSGGYTPAILELLMQKTTEARKETLDLIDKLAGTEQ